MHRGLAAAAAVLALSACAGAGGTQSVAPVTGTSRPANGSLSLQRSTTAATTTVSTTDSEGPNVAYDSIPAPLHAVASVGFEASQGLELGDGVNLTHAGRLTKIRYVLSSWGCQSGRWYTGNCTTIPNATFTMPITVNVYAVDNSSPSHVGNLIVSKTSTFNIPFRPSSNPRKCDSQRFYSNVDAACVHGLAHVVMFDFFESGPTLPSQVIVSLVYNTTHNGPQPIGESAPCYHSSAGCGYDSLNVSTDGNGGPIGSPVDPNGIFASFTSAGEYCSRGTGFRLDTPCWTGQHPQFEVDAVAPRGPRTTS